MGWRKGWGRALRPLRRGLLITDLTILVFFGLVSVVGLIEVRSLWHLDAAQIIELKGTNTVRRLTIGFTAAGPILLTWSAIAAVGGLVMLLDDVGLGGALLDVIGFCTLGLFIVSALVAFAAAFYGYPRRVLLPAFRSESAYNTHVRNV